MLTELGKDVSMADIKAQYDGHAKNLVKYKPILARILKNTTEEFASYDVETIETFIEQNVKVSQVEVDPGGKKIFGKYTESNIPDEGKVYFDILFDAYKPNIPDDNELIGLLKALLSDKIGGNKKIEILENDYGLKMNEENVKNRADAPILHMAN